MILQNSCWEIWVCDCPFVTMNWETFILSLPIIIRVTFLILCPLVAGKG